MNKIGPNSSHSPPENRSSSAGVVTSFRSDRRNVDTSVNDKAADTGALSNQSVDMHALEQRIGEIVPNEVPVANEVAAASRKATVGSQAAGNEAPSVSAR